MNRPYIVVSYYTTGTIYEKEAQRLQASLEQFNIPHELVGIESLGDWWKNTGFKPTFLKRMLAKHCPKSIVWVDCDAEFLKYPTLFDTLDADVAVYVFDRSEYKRSAGGTEVLSGTVWLRSCPWAWAVVKLWEEECKVNARVWDQKSLEKVLGNRFDLLPAAYCKIFDRMKFEQDPVIVHYQASRRVQKHRI